MSKFEYVEMMAKTKRYGPGAAQTEACEKAYVAALEADMGIDCLGKMRSSVKPALMAYLIAMEEEAEMNFSMAYAIAGVEMDKANAADTYVDMMVWRRAVSAWDAWGAMKTQTICGRMACDE